jgi:hypothetical protein
VFTQRRVRLSEGGGLDMFRAESFGIPILEVLPARCRGRDIYAAIATRVHRCLKRPLSNQRSPHTSSISNVPSASTESKSTSTASTRANPFEAGGIRPLSHEDAVAGVVPRQGFCLRLVTGGNLHGDGCSRCHWLSRCQGCLVPDNDTVVDLRDGETIAIDWHTVVFEELMDASLACDIRTLDANTSQTQQQSVAPPHLFAPKRTEDGKGKGENAAEATNTKERAAPAPAPGRASTSSLGIPLAQCLEKFTEDERIEDVTCPKCKVNMSYSSGAS